MHRLPVGVVGAGMMGSEIALTFAMAGHPTLLTDANPETRAGVIGKLETLLEKAVGRGLFTAEQQATALANLTVVDDLEAYADRQLIVEAVFEDAGVKRETFARLDRLAPADCLFASNTSTLPISSLAAATSAERQKLFLGTHFFSPVHRMPLVEVIPAFETTPDTVERVLALCRAVGKTPIKVKDVAGFAVNRVLHALMIEAVRLVEEEVCTPEEVDTACRLGLGHPVGPFELMDLVGNGLCEDVQDILHQAYGPRFMPRPLLRQKVAAGHDGRRAGKGWRVG
ncbi:3-hydroxyacyl-CoA dehydrogenase family protein [Roseospirillum parvum]|uniref:3-hydroxybutyryl-CoA dehydrogenase n=1 Tax=Roseospirillum parvum TaxID=83401 RepID=A0A1G7UQQ0_9PROT|nr:3-hydroxyacyl-CoA dehydrogenase family protein [Roseospirillum parvum]SDG49807.1 3-hydroxybutyryl-CoA dehydrogenase [Roseospirillum parvum]